MMLDAMTDAEINESSVLLTTSEDDCYGDIQERGVSNALITDECYYPVHKARGWVRAYVTLAGTVEGGGIDYRMYLEGSSRFLLSAKQLNNDLFLISTHEDFPLSGIDGRERIGYVGSVSRQHDRAFLVDINHCHLCDDVIGRFACGRGENREVVARIAHSVLWHKQGNAEMRLMNISFPYLNRAPPAIMREGRRTWCPRTLLETGPASMPTDTTFQERIQHHPNNVKCVNKLPVWNEVEESLMLHFQANRVLATSACNFILYEERRLALKALVGPRLPPPPSRMMPPSPLQSHKQPVSHTGTAGAAPPSAPVLSPAAAKLQPSDSAENSGTGTPLPQPTRRSGQPMRKAGDQNAISADQAIMQFGRADSHRFILDFKYPMSPLQAFGSALSSFAFDSKKRNKSSKDEAWDSSLSSSALKSPVGRKVLRAGNLGSRLDGTPSPKVSAKKFWSSSFAASNGQDNTGYDSDASDSSKASISSHTSTYSAASYDSNASLASNFSNLSYISSASIYSQYSTVSSNGQGQQGNLCSLPSPANRNRITTAERVAVSVSILEQGEDDV